MDNNLIVQEEVNALFSPSDIDLLIKFEEIEAKAKVLKETKTKALLEIMKKYNIKSFKNDDLSITYVEPSVRKVVDTQRLKEEGLYEIYSKETPVKESVRISINYEN